MRMLAIETASEACSVALFEGGEMVARDHREIGRGHAETLVPMIAALPNRGRADRILVSLGPGSFTGVRIGIATARALGFAWKAEVLGYPTLAMVAVQAWQPDPRPVTVCMNGGHGEWFVQNFDHDAEDEARSLPPEEAVAGPVHHVIVGNRAAELAARFPEGEKSAFHLLPDAGKVPLLQQSWLTSNLAPIYGRGPDAVPMAAQGATA